MIIILKIGNYNKGCGMGDSLLNAYKNGELNYYGPNDLYREG